MPQRVDLINIAFRYSTIHPICAQKKEGEKITVPRVYSRRRLPPPGRLVSSRLRPPPAPISREQGRRAASSPTDKQTTMSTQPSYSQMGKHETVYRDIARCKEEGATIDNMDPSRPFLYLEKFDAKKMEEWMDLKAVWAAKSVKNDITMPDPTPKWVQNAFYCLSPCLEHVLKKDSVRCFLRLLAKSSWIMAWNFTISSETLTYMVRHNALRCAKVVLEGKAPKLNYMHANPNCIDPRFSWIQLTRLLAEKTDNLVDELWNYMKDGKLLQTAVLLLAAQKQIREVKPEGFHVLVQRIYLYYDSPTHGKGDTGEAQKQLEEKEALFKRTLQLVSIISVAGEVLDKYIQAHSEVLQVEVLAHVSSILKEFGFCHKEECIDVRNLRPYDCKNSDWKLHFKVLVESTEAVTEMSFSGAVTETTHI